jgi:hypothetical protein
VTGYREFKPLVTDLFRAPLLRLLSFFACGFAVMLVDQLVVQKVVTTAVGTRWSPKGDHPISSLFVWHRSSSRRVAQPVFWSQRQGWLYLP